MCIRLDVRKDIYGLLKVMITHAGGLVGQFSDNGPKMTGCKNLFHSATDYTESTWLLKENE